MIIKQFYLGIHQKIFAIHSLTEIITIMMKFGALFHTEGRKTITSWAEDQVETYGTEWQNVLSKQSEKNSPTFLILKVFWWIIAEL